MYYTHIIKEDGLEIRRKKLESIKKIYETTNKRSIMEEDRKEFIINSIDKEGVEVFFFTDGVIIFSYPKAKKVSFINLEEEKYNIDGFNGEHLNISFNNCVDATDESSEHFNSTVYNYALNYSNKGSEVIEIWKREASKEEVYNFQDREEEVKKQGIFKVTGERVYTVFIDEGDTMNIILFSETYNKDYVFKRDIDSIRIKKEQARIGLLSISE